MHEHMGLVLFLNIDWHMDPKEPIGFASWTLSNSEEKYSQVEKEGLACVFGSRDFMHISVAIPSH